MDTGPTGSKELFYPQLSADSEPTDQASGISQLPVMPSASDIDSPSNSKRMHLSQRSAEVTLVCQKSPFRVSAIGDQVPLKVVTAEELFCQLGLNRPITPPTTEKKFFKREKCLYRPDLVF